MKQLSITMMLFAGIALASCQKTAAPSHDAKKSPNLMNYALPGKPNPPPDKHSENNGNCYTPALNCGPEVVIIGKRPKLSELHVAIDNGPVAIGNFFDDEANWELLPVGDGQLIKLMSGDYNIIMRNNYPDPDRVKYFCGPTSSLSAANLSDAEFVIEIRIED
jgi:hypothetical protein